MTVDQLEVEMAVYAINQDIYMKLGDGDTHLFMLRYQSDGFTQWVEFMGAPLWDSEDGDVRHFIDEEKGEFEPIEVTLRRALDITIKVVVRLSDLENPLRKA